MTTRTRSPEKVIIVVLTDGKKSVLEIPDEVVRDRVETRRDDNHNRESLPIGATQDGALTVEKIGMTANNSPDMAHNDTGAENVLGQRHNKSARYVRLALPTATPRRTGNANKTQTNIRLSFELLTNC